MLNSQASIPEPADAGSPSTTSHQPMPSASSSVKSCGGTTSGIKRHGTVYFIQAGATGPIKIGYTSGDLKLRLRQLQTASAFPLRIVGSIAGNSSDEKLIHKHLSEQRLAGEWFDSEPDVLLTLAHLLRCEADRLETEGS